jgi:hypothetical protein
VRFKDEKSRNAHYAKKKLNPADLNFMPNPQYLLDNRIDQYLDLDPESATPSPEKQRYVVPKEDRLLMEVGIFKKLESPSMDESSASAINLKCYKCDKRAEHLEYKTNLTYCKRHAIDRAIDMPDTLSKIEVEKKSVLEDFSVKIKSSKTKLEEIRSLLRHSEVTL